MWDIGLKVLAAVFTALQLWRAYSDARTATAISGTTRTQTFFELLDMIFDEVEDLGYLDKLSSSQKEGIYLARVATRMAAAGYKRMSPSEVLEAKDRARSLSAKQKLLNGTNAGGG